MGLTSSRPAEGQFVPSDNDYELAIKSSKELEHLLDREFGAGGKGLHEKISSVERQLPGSLIKDMRRLATIRNKLIHEHGFDAIPDRQSKVHIGLSTIVARTGTDRERASKAAGRAVGIILRGHVRLNGLRIGATTTECMANLTLDRLSADGSRLDVRIDPPPAVSRACHLLETSNNPLGWHLAGTQKEASAEAQ